MDSIQKQILAVVAESYGTLFYEQLVYGTRDKMDAFYRWRGVLTPAQRVEQLERALSYELWLGTGVSA